MRAIQEFRQALSANDPAPVYILIKEGVTAWLQGEEWSSKVTQFPLLLRDCLKKALQDQAQIGWMQALKGYLSIEWRHSAASATSALEEYQEVEGFDKSERFNARFIN
jgi:hypothetical protein